MKKAFLLAAGICLFAVCFGGNLPLPSSAHTNWILQEKLSKESIQSPSTCFPRKEKDKRALFPYEDSEAFVLVR